MALHLPPRLRLLLHDSILLLIMGLLAACGLIYEYLLSHYAGRILGALETAIYSMIGLMIVSMGAGAFAARLIRDPFTGFAWLEALIALLGVTCILLIAALVGFTVTLPELLAANFALPPDLIPDGGLMGLLRTLAVNSPYLFGFLLGFLVGMEIPMIARVREAVYGMHLTHNAGTIYGADYLGAGVGAAIWVLLLLSMDVTRAAVVTALVNVLVGLIFLLVYWRQIRWPRALLLAHFAILLLAVSIYQVGEEWNRSLSNLLYRDKVIFSSDTRYQHITITERPMGPLDSRILGFFINGRLQFSSEDERIYHSMLVYPGMLLAGQTRQVLVIGGGDGLALRNLLRWQPEEVHLIDIDGELVDFFTPSVEGGSRIQQRLWDLNQRAFANPRVRVHLGDAFLLVNDLLAANRLFDVILVDLPDPSHPDLNRLYSDNFYSRLRQLLRDTGTIVVQSTSPYHARHAFLAIGKTLRAAGFEVDQYRQNVPSFGEWGWSIGTRSGPSPLIRLQAVQSMPVPDEFLTPELIRAAFVFPADFFADLAAIQVNYLGSQQVYQYHQRAWQRHEGVYRPDGG